MQGVWGVGTCSRMNRTWDVGDQWEVGEMYTVREDV